MIHTGLKPFQCNQCDKSFNQKVNLLKHQEGHQYKHLKWNRTTTEKPYKCNFGNCLRSFTIKSSLSRHIKSHQFKHFIPAQPAPCVGNENFVGWPYFVYPNMCFPIMSTQMNYVNIEGQYQISNSECDDEDDDGNCTKSASEDACSIQTESICNPTLGDPNSAIDYLVTITSSFSDEQWENVICELK